MALLLHLKTFTAVILTWLLYNFQTEWGVDTWYGNFTIFSGTSKPCSPLELGCSESCLVV